MYQLFTWNNISKNTRNTEKYFETPASTDRLAIAKSAIPYMRRLLYEK